MTHVANALPLAGKMALLTGGSGGIGMACARSFVRDGASVTLMGRRLEALIDARRQLQPELAEGATVELFAGDALEKDDVVAAIELASSIHGKLDICVSTVGGGSIRPLLMHDAESFSRELELNIVSAFLLVRHSVQAMIAAGGGAIVCISFRCGETGISLATRLYDRQVGPGGVREGRGGRAVPLRYPGQCGPTRPDAHRGDREPVR